ncbi:MAG TPA: transcriptional repressor [Nitrospira sp.]|nr:transcriptional repressor [Nitrospira sp.]
MNLYCQELRERFRRHSVRLTRQRAAIYAALTSSTSHPTVDDLYRIVKREHPMMSRNTVYYTVGVLRQAGLVREVNVGHDAARFDGNATVHHHLICVRCRQIEDVMDEGLNQLDVSSEQAKGFRILGHRVEFHGYCKDCQRSNFRVASRSGTHSKRSCTQGGHHGQQFKGHEESRES